MLQSKISFLYLNCVPPVSCSNFVCDSVISLWTCGLKMQQLWVVCFYVSLFYYYHHRHQHYYYYYYHLFWGDYSYMLISLGWWNADQRKAWECLWQQHFSDFSWASLPFACGWDWAFPARSGAERCGHATSSHCLFSGCVLCPPGSKRKWERMASQSVGKMTHWIIFCIANITLEFLPMYRYSQAASLMYLYLFMLRNASVNTLTYFFKYFVYLFFSHIFFKSGTEGAKLQPTLCNSL